jgi:hypothetical protein
MELIEFIMVAVSSGVLLYSLHRFLSISQHEMEEMGFVKPPNGTNEKSESEMIREMEKKARIEEASEEGIVPPR